MFAATAMAMSSISVVTSSLLLKTYSPKFDFKKPNKVSIDAAGGLNSNNEVQMTALGAIGSSVVLNTDPNKSSDHLDSSNLKLISK